MAPARKKKKVPKRLPKFALARSKEKARSTSTSLMNMPPEIRNRIYTYLFRSADYHDLATFKHPAIVAVSRTIHHEALPIFFAETTFNIGIGGNFAGHAAIEEAKTKQEKNQLRYSYRRRKNAHKAGTLGIQQGVMKYLRQASMAVVIRNVVIEVCRPENAKRLEWRPKGDGDAGGILFGVMLDWTAKDRLRVRYDSSEDYLRASDPYEHDVRPLFRLFQAAAMEKAERKGFNGFTVRDLQELGWTLRKF